MNRAIELNGKACLKADKIDNKFINWKLTPEFYSAQPSVAQFMPKGFFGHRKVSP